MSQTPRTISLRNWFYVEPALDSGLIFEAPINIVCFYKEKNYVVC